MIDKGKLEAYWAENKKLTAITLIIWFVVSFGAAIAVNALNKISFMGFPLGYYMGAQGSLIVFVLLIANYARAMGKIDRKFDVQEGEE